MTNPPPGKVVLVFAKEADSASVQSVISDQPLFEAHVYCQDTKQSKQLFVRQDKMSVARLLGKREEVVAQLLSDLAAKLMAGADISFTKEEATALLATAGETIRNTTIDTSELNVPGPFKKEFVDVEFAIAEEEGKATSAPKIGFELGVEPPVESGRVTLGIVRDEDVA